ncbi:uncharacterized protein LOC129570481 [Sitodiplosis mosellana]|uniref:uncharacterized protein LOC129570481 n=1 Tax=Sitodiplosis mosellana TaxID=263140 RepID=UPI002443A752|nr:uncharacterized protein LOC129570481 [Sitodiplosis mosellana]
MMSKQFLVLLLAFSRCHSLSHRVGNDTKESFPLHEENLFSQNAAIAQNYVIAYKFSNAGMMGIIHYVQLDVIGAQQTNASIKFVKDVSVLERRRVDALVQIQNATDFIASIRIMGKPGFKFEDMWLTIGYGSFKPRSSALICTEQTQKKLQNKKRIFKFGKRTIGDFLVHFQSGYGTVKKLKRPEFIFDFHDSQVNITYLVLASSSPWAISLHNKILITDNRFRATVYGLDEQPFTTTLIIYGKRN